MSEKNKEENKNIQDAEIVEDNKSSNKIMYILIPILIVIGLVAGIFLSPMIKGLFGGGKHEGEKSIESGESKNKEVEAEANGSEESASTKKQIDPKSVVYINVPDVLVNLKTDHKSRPVFLKISIVLEAHGEHAKDAIEPSLPKVIDQMQLFLRDLDIADVTGANNLQRLRRELLMRVNNVLSPQKIDDVLIKEFLVQ